MGQTPGKLGLIAGGGDLPREIVAACRAADRAVFVIRLRGITDPALGEDQAVDCGLAELGRALKALKHQGCVSVCFAGRVSRPDFAALRPDLRGLAALPGAIFIVEGADQIVAGLTLGLGVLGRHAPSADHQLDIERAMDAARALGRLDIGQAAVAARGLVLAVEAQEGTDAMLARSAQLPAALRGTSDRPEGVLAKAPKPIQDRRIDLPTIGAVTLIGAARAGLAGVVGEAGGLLLIDRARVIATADDLGLFVLGLPPLQPHSDQP
jgi:DUF1009 family protein